MSYQAIIFDLDGTAMPSARHAMPNEVVCNAVRSNRDKIKLCAATGRAWPHTKPVVGALGVKELSIICGGTQIIDPVKEQIVWQQTLADEAVKAILEIAKQYNYLTSFAKDLEASEKVEAIAIEPETDANTFYILDVPTKLEADEVAAKLSKIEGITISMAYSWFVDGGVDLHITSSQATKEHAVMELCDRLGIDRLDVAGVGDGFNDIHLFNAVGHKVAMGNAVLELKEAADEVIEPQGENGLAKFIERAAA